MDLLAVCSIPPCAMQQLTVRLRTSGLSVLLLSTPRFAIVDTESPDPPDSPDSPIVQAKFPRATVVEFLRTLPDVP